MLHHHYGVSSSEPGSEERRFHLFEEADAHFSELSDGARSAGLELSSESYWRRHYRGADEAERVLALDDCGLTECDALCGGA